MARLLGTWELGKGYGHIAHLAPLAQALTARGHAMTVAVRHPATARAAPGAPFADILQTPVYRFPPSRTPTLTYAQVIADGGFADPPAAIALVRDWLALFARTAPDALVAEHAPMSLLAAYVAGLPAALFGAGWVVPPRERPLPSLTPWRRVSEAERAAADAAADAVVREVCRAFGAPVLDGLAALIAQVPPYLTTLPELDPYGPRRGATYYGVMNGFRPPRPAAWPAGGGRRALAYLPFDHPLAPALVEALGALGWPTVWHWIRVPPFALPRNIVHTLEPIDLVEALADCDLLLSRGGHASSCEALMAGRPNFILPDSLDTILIARRLSIGRFGAATATDADSRSIGAAIEALVDDGAVAANLADARARYLGYRPALAATQLADRLLADLRL